MVKTRLHIVRILALLLLLLCGSIANQAWAATVTYHILTLPIDNTIYKMKSDVNGKRLEAVKIIVDQTAVELPAHYKSPLAENFKYYETKDITGHGGSAVSLYDDVATCKGVLYEVKGDATEVKEGSAITGSTAEYYVVYTYKTSNTIAKLDGTVNYNIGVKGKGFLSLNRGRNNRPAVIPTAKVDAVMLASEDFSYVANPGNGIGTYWKDNNNKNDEAEVGSQFFFGFNFVGQDPYNIIIRTSYNRDITFIEKNEGTQNFVYKWYKGAALMAKGDGNVYLASDDHKQYTATYSSGSANPTDPARVTNTGYFHGNDCTWGTVALLNNTSTSGDGYVLLGTRTVDGNGAVPTPGNDNKYNYLTFNGNNNMNFKKNTAADATKNHTIDGIYPLKKVTFKVVTPFYKVSPTTDHIVSAPTEWVSQYTVDNEDINPKYLPTSLKRKYCNPTGKFYKDAACTQEITKFSQATDDPTEGYQIYIGYVVSANIPFKAITPKSSYTDAELDAASWYELTDEGSTQEYGRKIKYDGSSIFKNNGASGTYEKTSEYAFIGDPYELHILLRSATAATTPHTLTYVGTDATNLTTSTSVTAGFKWELPVDDTAGSFLLRKYKGTGCWLWNAGQLSQDYAHGTDYSGSPIAAEKDAQTITFNISGLAGNKYLKVTTSGDIDQIESVTPSVGSVVAESGTTQAVIVKLKANTESAKTITVTIQEYTDNEGASASGSPTIIQINQGTTSSFAGNTVQYSTTSSTRVKVLTLPEVNITYNIVDKSGRIAVKASTSQTIFSPISLATVPSIIISPFILDETVKFYDDNYTGNGRGNLTHEVSEVSNVNDDIFITYTTSKLDAKPINLSEEQELNVKLNGQYIYYDKEANALKTKASPTTDELNSSEYLWKLRNRDPYAMLIDNLGAREDLGVNKQSETPTIYDDDGGTSTPSRQKGAWVDLASIVNEGALSFTTNRADAQQFIAKASLQGGVYEVMVADGGSVDASTTYYDIGCPEANTVKIYNNTTYAHGNDVLRFVLNQNIAYTYYLIDKAKHILLTADSKTPDLALPAEYQSPLVATYHFYASDQIDIDETKTPHEYTPKNPATKITNLSGLNATYTIENSDADAYSRASSSLTATDETNLKAQADKLPEGYYYFQIGSDTYKKVTVSRAYQGTHIYVTYDVNDVVTFNTGQYMLKFLDPAIPKYHLEDGKDKLTSETIQPIYPYCNGDGNLNVYGDEMQTEQFNGGASTRPRWAWYFDSTNSDPYHVSIRSKSTIKYNDVSHYTYLTTYAVHFNQDTGENADKKRVVTGGTLPTIASITPTEYMVLGTQGSYRLLTTNAIDDGETNVRRNVTSLEQYWKTYNMVRQDILGDSRVDKNDPDRFNDPITMPSDRWTELKTNLASKGVIDAANRVDDCSWHSYKAYANATRWNGYNDKSNGYEKKVVENLEHWYQTFDMGNGTFDIESADIPPVLVLLDRHGWEIMRRPLPPISTYPSGDELVGLRVYDSPLVDKYYFYNNATKASGCHKYTLRLNDDQTEKDQIKLNGEHYSSSSLGDLPPKNASGVISGGAIQDFYVTYTVKEEYENNYDYDLNENTSPYTESGKSKPYLVLQNKRFYKTENSQATDIRSYFTKPISEHTNPEGGNVYDLIVNPKNHGGTNDNILDGSGKFLGNIFWYVEPNLNIDDEMGIPWVKATGEDTEEEAKNKLRKDYKDKTGFDPYNIQLRLKNKNDGTTDGRYLTTHMTSTTLNNGIYVGEYNNLTATNADDVDTQAKKLSRMGKYYFKQADADSYWLVNVTRAYDGMTDAAYTKESGSYATEWAQQPYKLTLEAACTSPITSEGNDHSTMQITNQTFMAVSDVNGNMQLMPRFDHTKRVHLPGTQPWHTTLSDPVDHAVASADNNASMGPQTIFFVSPQRYHYHIIDNYGREALRYKRGADTYPAITDHFKSPLAKDFTYYSGLAEGTVEDSNAEEWDDATGQFKRTLTNQSIGLSDIAKLLPTAGTYYYRIGARGNFSWKKVTVAEGKGLSDKQITGSFAAAKLEGSADGVDYQVYVRYEYDEDADHEADHILQGRWFTAKLADKDLQASGTVVYNPNEGTLGMGVNFYAGEETSRSLTATNTTDLDAQADKLTAIGDYYFRVGNDPSYNYYKVTVTTAYDGSTDAVHTDDPDDGTKGYDTKWSNSKPLVIDADAKKWQWKFFVAPTVSTSDYYTEPDPYAVILFNRQANYTTNPSAAYSPMGVGIKVPNANDGADRFALLSHPDGGYAMVVAKEYDNNYNYLFLNGASMTIPSTTAATTALETGFNYKTGTLTNGAQLVLNDDVTYNFTYYVITNDNKLAITATQDNDEADSHDFAPYLPESAQSPLLNMIDYLYYGFAAHPDGDTYSVITQSILTSLTSLYDDVVYVRYNFDTNNTPYFVPNKKATVDGRVARHEDSNDVPIDINGKLPYNIIWYNDNMMASDGSTISDGGVQDLTGVTNYTWRVDGGDPYALKIKKTDDKYIDASARLSATAQTFMLLRKEGYDYGVFAKTGDKTNMLSFGTLANPSGEHTLSISTTDPNKFVPFALSTHKLVYHLIINTSKVNTTIPYREGTEDNPSGTLGEKDILGTTQRDLTSQINGIAGDKYQLGETYMGQTYCVDAGQVSIGDELIVPNVFSRPNCVYFYYIDNIQTAGEGGTYQKTATSESDMNEQVASVGAVGNYYFKIAGQYVYRKITVTEAAGGGKSAVYENSLSSAGEYTGTLTATDMAALKSAADALASTGDYYYKVGPIDLYKRAKVTAVPPVTSTIADCTKDDYDNCWQDDATLNNRFKGLEVKKLMSASELVGSLVKVNVEYRMATLETNAGDNFITEMKPAGTHYLWYTFETAESTPQLAHYTHVRGMRAESGRALRYTNDYLWAPLGDPYGFKTYNRYIYKNNGGTTQVLTTDVIADNQEVAMGVPGTGVYESKNEIYELLPGSTPGSGTFRVHPLLNTTNTLYLRVKDTGDARDRGKLILSNATPVQEWTYGLSEELLNPYYQGAGNVGGLNDDGKTAYETAKTDWATNPARLIRELQQICYNKDNIVDYASGYYRLCNQPGASSISPQRYASGYLHQLEVDVDGNGNESDAIPMHFYSKRGVTGSFDGDKNPLKTGFTSTDATRGEIPIPATEYDASTIFQFIGDKDAATMKTQGLYVKGVQTTEHNGHAVMTSAVGEATSFHVDDIGGAVVIIYNDDDSRRHYINYAQNDSIYELKYYENVDVAGSKWCMEPANTQKLKVATNNGGDGYYYATFYAPFDVQLPADALDGTKTYNAYTCKTWDDAGLNPDAVPAVNTYAEGKFVPAGIPVIIRVKDESGAVTLTLPTTAPTASSITTELMGTYLEKLLPLDTGNKWNADAYTMGVPMTSIVNKDGDYDDTGEITAPLPEFATSGVGFYINATPNKEADSKQALWQRNNRYVLHNKIYYRAGGGSSRQMRGIEFVPVIFDDEEGGGPEEEKDPADGTTIMGDGCIYDLLGRKVATKQQVENGSWSSMLQPGIYILNGKKFKHK